MGALQSAKDLRNYGFVTGPNLLQYIWWKKGRFSTTDGSVFSGCVFFCEKTLSWKEVKQLLKLNWRMKHLPLP